MYGLASLPSNFSSYELIASCIPLIVLNIQTGTPSNPSEALENVGIVVLLGPMLADTDDAVEEVGGGGGGSGRTAIEAGADQCVSRQRR